MNKIFSILFLITIGYSVATSQSNSNKIEKVKERKYIYKDKGYIDDDIKKMIIDKKKGDPLYDGVITYEESFKPASFIGVVSSIPIILLGVSIEQTRRLSGVGKFVIGGGGIILIYSIFNLKKLNWFINDLPAAIDIWNNKVDQDLSNIPRASFGITSNGIGINYNF